MRKWFNVLIIKKNLKIIRIICLFPIRIFMGMLLLTRRCCWWNSSWIMLGRLIQCQLDGRMWHCWFRKRKINWSLLSHKNKDYNVCSYVMGRLIFLIWTNRILVCSWTRRNDRKCTRHCITCTWRIIRQQINQSSLFN